MTLPWRNRASALWSTLVHDRRGGVAVTFGLSAVVLVSFASAAVTYGQLALRTSQLQTAADHAVLAAAREIRLVSTDDRQVVSVARTAALAALAQGRPEGTTATPKPAVVRDGQGERVGVEITLTETVVTPMGRLLSMPTATLVVKAEAKLAGTTKICLIGLDEGMRGTVHLRKEAQITATGCALYVNSRSAEGLIGDDNATVKAALVCSSGGFKEGKKGVSFQPAARTSCPRMADPLLSRPPPSYPGTCSSVSEVRGTVAPPRPKKDKGATRTAATADGAGVVTDTGSGVELNPGLYCDGLLVNGGAKVRLRPGIYVMRGPLIVDAASLAGQNVGFYFEGDQASLLFDEDSTVSLTAPRDGDMAGLLMFEQRQVSQPEPAPVGKKKGKAPEPSSGAGAMRQYRIISDDAQTLLGTIYLPSGRLIIDSSRPVASQSAYTVIVARAVELFDGPNLVLNANYGSTDIPVPKGVGPVGQNVNLTR